MKIDKAIRFLFGIDFALAAIGISSQLFADAVGQGKLDQWHLRTAILAFNLDAEANVPTWYSSTLLIATAAVLAFIAINRRDANQPEWKSWGIAAGFFAFLSLDECASIHNMAGTIAGLVLKVPGPPLWPFAAMVGLLIAYRACRHMRFHAEPGVARQFRIAIGAYLAGTLGVEQIGLYLQRHVGEHVASYSLAVGIEETLEMVGATLFLRAALYHAAACANPITVRLVETSPNRMEENVGGSISDFAA